MTSSLHSKAGQPHSDFETHAYTSLVQLTANTGLIIYQQTAKTIVNVTRTCDNGQELSLLHNGPS